MPSVVDQLYSQTHWGGIDGVQTVWNFTFSGGYILPAHVKAYTLNASGDRSDLVVTEGMLTGEFQLTISPALPATTSLLVIYRDTPKDLPLVDFVDGARVTERNLDRIARQAVFVSAEVLDGASVSAATIPTLGFRNLLRNAYTGASVVTVSDSGKAHSKSDSTGITVPSTLDEQFITTLSNLGNANLTVTFTGAVLLAIDGNGTTLPGLVVTIPPYSTATIWRATTALWLLSGNVTAV